MLPNYETSVTAMVGGLQSYPWHNKYSYGQYLAQTYYYVRHSTRLLAASAARFSQADQKLHKRFLKHTQEEASHELLALHDLQKLGYRIDDFPELPQTCNLYETQYFKIEHKDPAALMGYILALETVAAKECSALKERLTQLWGADVVSFIRVHGDEDPNHIGHALEVIRNLDDRRLPEIDLNIRQTASNYTQMLTACRSFG